MPLKFILKSFLVALLTVFLASCAPHMSRWERAIYHKVAFHARTVQLQLKPYFSRAKIKYPPTAITLVVFKNTKKMELWGLDGKKQWRYIRTYPVLAASGGVGPKLAEGDQQVPEGIYHINEMNPFSHFDLSLQLDYPNEFDRNHAKLEGRTHLGGQIFIHGSRYSIGCLAIGNTAIEQLFVLAYWVGMQNITVIIAPNDLRSQPILWGKNHPGWLDDLYVDIKQQLHDFNRPPKEGPILPKRN
jgi:murein L,D-transpeptidase YafK